MWDDARQLNALAGVLGALAMIALAWGAASWLVRQPVFAIREIAITGPLERVNAGHIEAVIRGELAGTFFTLDLDKSRVAQCKRRSLGLVTQELPLREWDLSSLHVRYNPLGSCATDNSSGSGWVQVELASYRQLSHQVREEQRAAEPKM